MTLLELKTALSEYPDKAFRLRLPSGDQVPVSFHITEVGHVQKTFFDCGGTLHRDETCQLQAWVGSDEDHRIASGKMATILEKSRSIFPHETLPVEIEYGEDIVSQYPVVDFTVEADQVILNLTTKHTDCLAKELCGVPTVSEPAEKSCCGSGGCC